MKKKKILEILDELDKKSRLKPKEELELELEEYAEILEIMTDDGLLSGVQISRVMGKRQFINLNAKITIQGIEYLEQNQIKE